MKVSTTLPWHFMVLPFFRGSTPGASNGTGSSLDFLCSPLLFLQEIDIAIWWKAAFFHLSCGPISYCYTYMYNYIWCYLYSLTKKIKEWRTSYHPTTKNKSYLQISWLEKYNILKAWSPFSIRIIYIGSEFPKTISTASMNKNHSHVYLCPASFFSYLFTYMAWND